MPMISSEKVARCFVLAFDWSNFGSTACNIHGIAQQSGLLIRLIPKCISKLTCLKFILVFLF